MKQLTAQEVSDGWVITIRQVFHVKDKKDVDRFIHYHGMEKNEYLCKDGYVEASG